MVVDGNDVLAVRAVAEAAVERARSGGGPTLIEAKTFRVRPHSAATPTESRPADLIRHWEERDPIQSLAAVLGGEHGVDQRSASPSSIAARPRRSSRKRWSSRWRRRPRPAEAVEDVYAPSAWQSTGRLS